MSGNVEEFVYRLTPKKISVWQRLQGILNLVNHVIIVAVALFFTTLAYRLDFKDTALHVFLTMIGYHLLMAEAMMSHYPINSVTIAFKRRNKTKFHGLMQLVGGSMALTGGVIKFAQTEGSHFTTWHGRMGLAASFMCTASLIGGLVNYFQPKIAHRIYPPSEIKYRHNLFGMVTFTLGMAAIWLGYGTLFFDRHIGNAYNLGFSLITLAVLVLTLISPMASLLDKRKYRNRK